MITLCFLAANMHKYLCQISTNNEDSTITFSAMLTRNLPPFPMFSTTKKNKMMPTKPHTLPLLYLCGLIIQAGDLHPNPGPTSDPSPKYPCGTCSHEVHDHHHAIQCDECDCWYHTACVQINETTYEQLKYQTLECRVSVPIHVFI